MMIVAGYTEPIIDTVEGHINLINEFFVLFFTYHLYQFTDFTTDTEARDKTGKSLVVVTLLNVLVNIVAIGK